MQKYRYECIIIPRNKIAPDGLTCCETQPINHSKYSYFPYLFIISIMSWVFPHVQFPKQEGLKILISHGKPKSINKRI